MGRPDFDDSLNGDAIGDPDAESVLGYLEEGANSLGTLTASGAHPEADRAPDEE